MSIISCSMIIPGWNRKDNRVRAKACLRNQIGTSISGNYLPRNCRNFNLKSIWKIGSEAIEDLPFAQKALGSVEGLSNVLHLELFDTQFLLLNRDCYFTMPISREKLCDCALKMRTLKLLKTCQYNNLEASAHSCFITKYPKLLPNVWDGKQ